MTLASAQAAIDRMEVDEDFTTRVQDAGGPEASIAVLRSEGFDVTPSDMRDVFLDRFGDELTQEQLDAVAAGSDDGMGEMFALTVVACAVAAAIYV
jgi:predicted ribosomally synthesized peptide with nif11-like leader